MEEMRDVMLCCCQGFFIECVMVIMVICEAVLPYQRCRSITNCILYITERMNNLSVFSKLHVLNFFGLWNVHCLNYNFVHMYSSFSEELVYCNSIPKV